MTSKFLKLVTIVIGLLLVSTCAYAAPFATNVQFDIDGDGAYDITNVESVDWYENGVMVVDQDITVTPISGGPSYTTTLFNYFSGIGKADGDVLELGVHAQAELISFSYDGGGSLTMSQYNADNSENNEITMALSMKEYATYSTDGSTYDRLTFTGAAAEAVNYAWYIDDSADANRFDGTGYTDGDEILSGRVDTIYPGTSFYTTMYGDPYGLGSGGSTSLLNTVDIYDETYIDTDPASLLTILTGTTFYTTVQFSDGVSLTNNATVGYDGFIFTDPDNTNRSGDENGIVIKIDANTTSFLADTTVVPEPATFALLGLGMLAFAGISRRKLIL